MATTNALETLWDAKQIGIFVKEAIQDAVGKDRRAWRYLSRPMQVAIVEAKAVRILMTPVGKKIVFTPEDVRNLRLAMMVAAGLETEDE